MSPSPHALAKTLAISITIKAYQPLISHFQCRDRKQKIVLKINLLKMIIGSDFVPADDKITGILDCKFHGLRWPASRRDLGKAILVLCVPFPKATRDSVHKDQIPSNRTEIGIGLFVFFDLLQATDCKRDTLVNIVREYPHDASSAGSGTSASLFGNHCQWGAFIEQA